jgi:hypothetical protein
MPLRSKLIRVAATFPAGSESRKALLNILALDPDLWWQDPEQVWATDWEYLQLLDLLRDAKRPLTSHPGDELADLAKRHGILNGDYDRIYEAIRLLKKHGYLDTESDGDRTDPTFYYFLTSKGERIRGVADHAPLFGPESFYYNRRFKPLRR